MTSRRFAGDPMDRRQLPPQLRSLLTSACDWSSGVSTRDRGPAYGSGAMSNASSAQITVPRIHPTGVEDGFSAVVAC